MDCLVLQVGIFNLTLWGVKEFNNCKYKLTQLHTLLGRHCCLWCTISKADLKVPLSIRGRSPARSLETLKEDHKKFMDAGGNIKTAKQYNNVIGTALFPIPLDRVRAAT